MEINQNTNILITGLGVMGGSYAKALSKQGLKVNCITKSQSDIDLALKTGCIYKGTVEIDPQMVGSADLVIFALYPHIFIDWIKENQHLLKAGAIITDVTGVKNGIVQDVQSILRKDVEFIACHPMAGRESSGFAYSDDNVFKGANFIITPTELNTENGISTARSLGTMLGFLKISELTPQEHDKMIAFLSQLTHCIAVTLMNCNNTPNLESYTGDSFRDLTRIAKINAEMWSELFIWNKNELAEQMDNFIEHFEYLKEAILSENKEHLRELMQNSTQRRSLFDKPKN